jgi:excisionase family DNA binding protein
MTHPSTAPEPARSAGADDQYLSPEDLAALLNLPMKTLAAWRSHRKGPIFYRIGVHVRYPKTHVDRWLAELEADAQKWMAS